MILNEKSNKTNKPLHYFLINNENIKIDILNMSKTNIYLLGVFKGDVHYSIRKIFLLHILLSFLNYMGENSCFILKEKFQLSNDNDTLELEKINVYSNKDSTNNNKDFISSDNNNFIEGSDNSNNDLLYSKIYEFFLLLPIIKFFILITQTIFIRYNYYYRGAAYKNFYFVEINSGDILFSMENIFNLNNGYHPSHSIKLNKAIWEELLHYGHMLKNDYIKQCGKILDFIDYQTFYVRIELTCTHPRIIFIVRFMPLLNGIILIHEYHMNNYPIEGCYDEKYKEIDVMYGNSMTREEESEEIEDYPLLINEPKFIKEIEYFFINFFLSTNSNINDCFYIKNSKIKYFSDDILNIINNSINKKINISNSLNIDNIILTINNELYNKYLEIYNEKEKNQILIGTNKVIYNNISNSRKNNKIEKEKEIIDLEILTNDNEKIINQSQWNYSGSPYIKNLFQIEEKFILIVIFNYRKDIKNNELTIDLSKLYDSYSPSINKENKTNRENLNKSDINNFDKNNPKNEIENLSVILNDKISDCTDSSYILEKSTYKDKKSFVKKNSNKIINKIKENLDNNKASDEDKSKDRINYLNENEKSSLFNLDFTNISKNDIAVYNSLKLDKESHTIKSCKRTEINKSIRKKSLDKNSNNINKVNTLKMSKNSHNIMLKNKTIDIDCNMEEREISNINFLPIQHDISFNKKEKNKKDKNHFLDKYFETVSSSCDNFYFEKKNKNKKKTINNDK